MRNTELELLDRNLDPTWSNHFADFAVLANVVRKQATPASNVASTAACGSCDGLSDYPVELSGICSRQNHFQKPRMLSLGNEPLYKSAVTICVHRSGHRSGAFCKTNHDKTARIAPWRNRKSTCMAGPSSKLPFTMPGKTTHVWQSHQLPAIFKIEEMSGMESPFIQRSHSKIIATHSNSHKQIISLLACAFRYEQLLRGPSLPKMISNSTTQCTRLIPVS